MRSRTIERLKWLKKRNIKLLKKRSRRKKRKKRTSPTINNHLSTLKTEKIKTFNLPTIFSITNNTESLINTFNDIFTFITDKSNFNQRIFFNIRDAKDVSADALMYLIAILNNLNENFILRYYFSGNEPIDPIANRKFKESGFYDYVKARNKESVIVPNNKNKIKILSGNDTDPELIGLILDFITNNIKALRKKYKYLYKVIIELMANVREHAYSNESILKQRWYFYAEKHDGYCDIVLLDTGDGIPSTIRKKLMEKIIHKDNELVVSALDSHNRSSTRKAYRGKGLPLLKKMCHTGKIKEMNIISNQALINISRDKIYSYELNASLKGTLFSFAIELN